jgi:cellobiose phosphorylase
MIRVGEGGRGESTWLAWSLHQSLSNFALVAEARGDGDRAAEIAWILNPISKSSTPEATLLVDPCIPRSRPVFQVSLRYRGTRYEIAVENLRGVNQGLTSLQLDGEALPAEQGRVPLVDDGRTHSVRVVLG